MISQICEAFNCPPDVAMRQDLDLCTNILLMRRFAATWEQMKRDKKQLSPKDWEFLEWADALQDQD